MPEPKRPSWDELLTGKDDDHWVEVEGVVTEVDTQLNRDGGRAGNEGLDR